MQYIRFVGDNEYVLLSNRQGLTLGENNYSAQTWQAWSNTDLETHNIYPLLYTDYMPTRFHSENGIDEFEIVDGVVRATRVWEAMPLESAKELAYEILAQWRWEKETGGITLGETFIYTDRETQAKLTSAYIKAQANSEFTIDNWKFGANQFLTLDAQTIITIGDAIVAHVQACFDEEALYSSQVAEAETVEEVENILKAYPQ